MCECEVPEKLWVCDEPPPVAFVELDEPSCNNHCPDVPDVYLRLYPAPWLWRWLGICDVDSVVNPTEPPADALPVEPDTLVVVEPVDDETPLYAVSVLPLRLAAAWALTETDAVCV